jgi:hypothetical protein
VADATPLPKALGGLIKLMYTSRRLITGNISKGGVPWLSSNNPIHFPFERISKRRKGYPSETQVKRGQRIVGDDKYLVEKLGRNDPCPCGSGRKFQEVLPPNRTVRGQRSRRLLLGKVAMPPNQSKKAPAARAGTGLTAGPLLRRYVA